MVESLIDRMDRWLSTTRADYYVRLQPGVTDEQLEAFTTGFPFSLPQAFIDLYRWRNGQDDMCSASFQNNFMFSSLGSIATRKDELDGMIGSDFEDPQWWRRGWIPFLDNGGGDHLCLDLVAEDGGNAGQILTFYHDSDRRQILYPSIELWLADLVESMEDGRYKVV